MFRGTIKPEKKKIYAGMMRTPYDEFFEEMAGGYVACSCGQVLQCCESVRDHWQAGHFDYPVYEEVD